MVKKKKYVYPYHFKDKNEHQRLMYLAKKYFIEGNIENTNQIDL